MKGLRSCQLALFVGRKYKKITMRLIQMFFAGNALTLNLKGKFNGGLEMADIMKMGKNPNYLGSWDLEELPNREVALVIENIKDEEVAVNNQKEICTVCYWKDTAFKPIILNVTNKKTLCKLYKTKDTEKLKGKTVVIGIDKVKAFGEVYDALRIRSKIFQLNAEGEKEIKCEQCGGTITAFKNMTTAQVASYRKKRYGKALCDVCALAASGGN